MAKLMQKYFHMELGKALGISGLFIASLSVFAFDKKAVILSILGTYFNGIILDYFIFGQTIKKRVCVITDKSEEVTDYILNRLHSGMSIYDIVGAYSHERKKEIVAVVDRQEYQKLMRFWKRRILRLLSRSTMWRRFITRPKNGEYRSRSILITTKFPI